MVVSNNVLFIFTPTWTNDPIWRVYFSDGWFNHQLVICSFKETKYPTQKLFSDRHLHPWYEFQAKKAVAAAKLKALFWGPVVRLGVFEGVLAESWGVKNVMNLDQVGVFFTQKKQPASCWNKRVSQNGG